MPNNRLPQDHPKKKEPAKAETKDDKKEADSKKQEDDKGDK
jgi:hypothetical protein